MSTTLVLIVAAIALVALAFVALRSRRDTTAVATANADDDPALWASGEAIIIGEVTPIDSNEPGVPPGTAQPPLRAAQEARSKPAQVYEARRQPEQSPRPRAQSPREPEPERQSDVPPGQPDPSTGSEQDRATQHVDIRWSKRFDPRDGALDDAARLKLLRDLGIVRAPWGVPLLTQAYEEEPAPEHRRAALRALAAYRHPDTQPTFELALRADDEETRAIAANALSALSIRAALPS